MNDFNGQSKAKDEKLVTQTNAIKKSTENNQPIYYNFCTITGKYYVLKVIALHHSLERHARHFTLWICCIDEFSYNLLIKMNLKNVVLMKVSEMTDDQLRKIKNERSSEEFCWTLKSFLIEHLLTENKIDSILYCDGDMFFFSDPKAIFDEWGESSVYLCPQRDYAYVEHKYGKYQAGLIGFKKDRNGLVSLKWWKEKCMEWCSVVPDKGRYGDQKYLDALALSFQNVKVSNHIGVDAAPWNCLYGDNHFHIHVKDQQVYLNNFKLVIFHFAKISTFSENDFDLWSLSPLKINGIILNRIYVPYLTRLREAMQEVKVIEGNAWTETLIPYTGSAQVKNYYKYS